MAMAYHISVSHTHTRLRVQRPWSLPLFGTQEIRVLMCQEVSAIQDVVLFDSQQVSGSDYSPLDSPSSSPAKSSFKSSSMNSLFGSLRSDRSLPSNLSGSQTVPLRRPTKLIPSIIPKLMFGTTPLAYKGSTTKIHLLNEPAQIMLTKTFSIHPTDVMAYTAASTRRGSFSSNNSNNATTEISGMSTISGHGDYRSHPRASRPMTAFIPESAYTSREDPSRKSLNGTVSSSMPNASTMRASRTARPGFDTRRMRRASQTSMENGTFNPTPLPSSFSHLDSLGNAKPALTQAARPKSFSIAVFIEVNNNSRLREFVFSHFALIESRLHHLQALCLELLLPKAGLAGNGHVRSIPDLARLSFQQDPRLQEAVCRLQQAIYQLYSAPRIQSPLWLNINTYPNKKATYSASFMTELIHLMEESPASGQLVSEVITAVLSHHVSWVPTIAPADQSLIRANPQGAYDPLWAQLSDIYGNIGTHSRISRTIVVGSNSSFVRRLLYILSYFIRCNEVFLRITEFQDDPDSLLNRPPIPPMPLYSSRTTYDLPEDHESGSPATLMRSISIPKRPRIDTFSATTAARGASSVSRASASSRMTSIGEPTTPIIPQHHQQQHDRDRPITPTVSSRRPLFDTSRPRMDTKDSISTESTPFHSRPTTPTTIESRPDSDRNSAIGAEENGYSNAPQTQEPHSATNNQHLRVDTTRSKNHTLETMGMEDTSRSIRDSGCSTNQDVLLNVPLPVSRVVCSFPPFPGSTTNNSTLTPTVNGGTNPSVSEMKQSQQQQQEAEEKVLPADILFCKSYGRSLMAPYVDRYMSDFALMGVPKFDFQHFMETDMRETMRHFESHPQERISSTVCIVADANTMKCNVFCAKTFVPPALMQSSPKTMDSGLGSGGLGSIGAGLTGGFDMRGEPVTRMPHMSTSAFMDATLHQMIDLAHSGLAAELCLNYLEDRLLQLYQCSRMLSSLVRDQEMLKQYPTLDSMAPLLGLHRSDMPLVLAVCSTYDDVIVGIFE
ncbi:Folliculin-interacting protein 1 [Haplosporangium sp. Z 767]|nr:Folliculin-interacting protein 1 [Haplosporangium sp. Z 11]KAF9189099.1 Folliculin-interacting protein 1 [Haplosporangium sp. Z 767]